MRKKSTFIPILLAELLLITAISISMLETSSKYVWRDEHSFDIVTADFEVSTDAAHKIIVYNFNEPTATVQYAFRNFKAETPDKYSTEEIKYQISIHTGDAEDTVDWDGQHSNFDFSINHEICPDDISPVYTMSADTKDEQTKSLRFVWASDAAMAHSEFVFVKVKVIAPYEQVFTYKITVLSKAKILIVPTTVQDPFENKLTVLSFMTGNSFGASLPGHLMKIKLVWNEYVDIDDTNRWILESMDDPLNAASIVNGGTEPDCRYFYVYLKPSSFVALNFYNTLPSETRGCITASVDILQADIPYYDTWSSTQYNETDGLYGWSKLPDDDIIIP